MRPEFIGCFGPYHQTPSPEEGPAGFDQFPSVCLILVKLVFRLLGGFLICAKLLCLRFGFGSLESYFTCVQRSFHSRCSSVVCHVLFPGFGVFKIHSQVGYWKFVAVILRSCEFLVMKFHLF